MKTIFIILLIILAASARFIPHLPNFTPIAAMALFGGVYLTDKRIAFIIPLSAMFLSDAIIGFHNTMWAVYLSFGIIVLTGFFIRKSVKPMNIFSASLFSSLLFFIVTNFAVWAGSTVYPGSVQGLILCYEMGIPFFGNTLLGDLFFNAALFGSFYFAQKRIPALAGT